MEADPKINKTLELTDKDAKVTILNEIQGDLLSIHKNLTSDLGI